MVTKVACESQVVAVEVFARGAGVTRLVTLPASGLPAGPCDLVLPDITRHAEAGSVRAELVGDRPLLGVRTRLVLPEQPAPPEPLQAQAREVERRLAAATRARARLARELERLSDLRPARRPLGDPQGRARDGLALCALLGELEAELDERLLALEHELEALDEERERLAAELSASATRRSGPGLGSACREVVLRLGPAGEGRLEAARVRYVVRAARWWPAYAARIAEGGQEAEWSLEAFVAQASGEPWERVKLGLSTADLAADVRLPELRALRLGKRQAPRRSGFRPPPAGLDELFAGYDARHAPPPAPPAPRETPEDAARRELERLRREREEMLRFQDVLREAPDGAGGAADLTRAGGYLAPMKLEAPGAPPAPMAARGPSLPGAVVGGLLALPGALIGAAGGGGSSPPEPSPSVASGKKRAGGAPSGGEEGAPPLEPDEQWLDFDRLVLGANDDSKTRGRLVPAEEAAGSGALDRALQRLEELQPPGRGQDPRAGRGTFDHRYDAEGLVDVAAAGAPQRTPLAAARAACRQRLRVVASEEQVAYREVELINPFEAPLLGGPVEVFVGAGLLTTASIERVGRGGAVVLGLGVEERVRVARNARVEERASGFLGGSTQVDHTIELTVRSSLPGPIELLLLDRLPVSDDPEVSVELLEAAPAAEEAEARETENAPGGAPIRGVLRWRLELPPGGEVEVRFTYRITLPAKRELVGGNRRD